MRGQMQEASMRIADVMTSDPVTVPPGESLRRAAELMDSLDIGALPVCEGERLVGWLTARDIAERVGADTTTDGIRVAEVMTGQVRWASTEDDPRAAELLMADLHVRRLPVMDVERKLVGIVSLSDLVAAGAGEAAQYAGEPAGSRIGKVHLAAC
jgi:CBS domain-containing protein